jgi:hypothetical protein
MVGYDRVCLTGDWSQVVGFVFANFDRNVFSVSVKMFSHLIYFTKNVIHFKAVCTENAIINCITVQYKNISFPLAVKARVVS